jgi:hypothetical protein
MLWLRSLFVLANCCGIVVNAFIIKPRFWTGIYWCARKCSERQRARSRRPPRPPRRRAGTFSSSQPTPRKSRASLWRAVRSRSRWVHTRSVHTLVRGLRTSRANVAQPEEQSLYQDFFSVVFSPVEFKTLCSAGAAAAAAAAPRAPRPLPLTSATGSWRQLAAGEALFNQGERVGHIHIVARGAVRMEAEGARALMRAGAHKCALFHRSRRRRRVDARGRHRACGGATHCNRRAGFRGR